MSKVIFFGMPSHGHVNPTLGLVNELVSRGEEVVYFASDEFKEKIEAAGAVYKKYAADLNIFKAPASGVPQGSKHGSLFGKMLSLVESSEDVIDDILQQVNGIKFDYMIYSAAFPFAKIMEQVFEIPAVSSLAVFAGLKGFSEKMVKSGAANLPGSAEAYRNATNRLREKYGVRMPASPIELLLNKGNLNLVYTSRYFAPDAGFFDDSYRFVGPPIFERKEDLNFPFDKLEGKKVIYISLGTVFGNYSRKLYNTFFDAFAGSDAIVVLAAHQVDLSQFNIPENFIVRNYVPQSALLKYTSAAITHAGMNSISDLIFNNIPFVALPLGADQPALARRAGELGAAISLDYLTVTPEILRQSVAKVLADPYYMENIRKISASFKEAGGYKKAVDEIFKLKKVNEFV